MEEIKHMKAEAELRQRSELCRDLACADSINTSQRDVLPSAAMDENDGAELKTASPAALSQCAIFVTPVNVKSRRSWPYKARHIANMRVQDGDYGNTKPQSDPRPTSRFLMEPLLIFDHKAVAGPSRCDLPNPITPITPETSTQDSELGVPEQTMAKPLNVTTGEINSQMNMKPAPWRREGSLLTKLKSIFNFFNSLGLWFK